MQICLNETKERSIDHLGEILMARIAAQLSRHNWSLKMLSDNSGVPYETIKKIASGKIQNPSLRTMRSIADAFGCSIDYLAGADAASPSA